jgi:multiple sugar transport system substrate-binding protein
MKKIKILVSGLLVLSMLAGVGCSSKTNEVSNKPAEKTKLVWAGWTGEEEANKGIKKTL